MSRCGRRFSIKACLWTAALFALAQLFASGADHPTTLAEQKKVILVATLLGVIVGFIEPLVGRAFVAKKRSDR